ncbi:hypothetical protein [Rhizobium leguminosarum]|uniref:hypothetical protein n=1 Tax=Rhizobium leguminosarum TaxID=384 RepID=UPI001FE14D37|nr:hypothetical protein [Rhizobium leguminosarum]
MRIFNFLDQRNLLSLKFDESRLVGFDQFRVCGVRDPVDQEPNVLLGGVYFLSQDNSLFRSAGRPFLPRFSEDVGREVNDFNCGRHPFKQGLKLAVHFLATKRLPITRAFLV